MKNNKKILALIVSIVTIINCFSMNMFCAYAHSNTLSIEYDDCIPTNNDDGSNERWYMLSEPAEREDGPSIAMHIDQNVHEIIYYFEPTSEDGSFSWTSNNVSPTEANEIKTAYANSMEKWNNVYFYSQDASGNLIKNRVIEVRKFDPEKDEDYNLSIYPADGYDLTASTYTTTDNMELVESVIDRHYHVSKWKMKVRVRWFYVNSNGNYDVDFADTLVSKSRTGAHEIGHILGLNDLDNHCIGEDHHKEILMGYGDPRSSRALNITYQDIAGVAIIRGFHTDSDHKWLLYDEMESGKYKLKCSICNGVKLVSSLSGYAYNEYKSCLSLHSLSNGNMMAVACYGDDDYYKCKYCSYVAPFSQLVQQNYTDLTYYNSNYHQYTNVTEDLEYTILEEHEYGSYSYNTNSNHIRTCACGHTQTQAHYIDRYSIVDGRYALCLGCNVLLDLENDYAQLQSLPGVKYSVNGSYLLPSGIAVLVDEDVEAYENGTLQFYNENDLPVTQ